MTGIRLLIREMRSFSIWVGGFALLLWFAGTKTLGATSAVVVGVLLGLIAYGISLRVKPWTDCVACNGSSKLRTEPTDRRHFSFCTWCGGSGRMRRLFAPAEDV
jgi:hypothetical protein